MSAIDDFMGGSFTYQFIPRSQGQGQAYTGPWALPFIGAATGLLAPAPLPLIALTKASSSVPEYSISRTIQTILEL
jgi:hypothetical protein